MFGGLRRHFQLCAGIRAASRTAVSVRRDRDRGRHRRPRQREERDRRQEKVRPDDRLDRRRGHRQASGQQRHRGAAARHRRADQPQRGRGQSAPDPRLAGYRHSAQWARGVHLDRPLRDAAGHPRRTPGASRCREILPRGRHRRRHRRLDRRALAPAVRLRRARDRRHGARHAQLAVRPDRSRRQFPDQRPLEYGHRRDGASGRPVLPPGPLQGRNPGQLHRYAGDRSGSGIHRRQRHGVRAADRRRAVDQRQPPARGGERLLPMGAERRDADLRRGVRDAVSRPEQRRFLRRAAVDLRQRRPRRRYLPEPTS